MHGRQSSQLTVLVAKELELHFGQVSVDVDRPELEVGGQQGSRLEVVLQRPDGLDGRQVLVLPLRVQLQAEPLQGAGTCVSHCRGR